VFVSGFWAVVGLSVGDDLGVGVPAFSFPWPSPRLKVNLSCNSVLGRTAMPKKNDLTIKIPTYDSLMNPILTALRELGGSGSVDEISNKVTELEKIPDDIASLPHDPGKSTQTETDYRMAWARTYLKKFGLLQNSARGVWSLTPEGMRVQHVDPQQIVRKVRGRSESPPPPESEEPWKQQLYALLTQKMDPAAFERLA